MDSGFLDQTLLDVEGPLEVASEVHAETDEGKIDQVVDVLVKYQVDLAALSQQRCVVQCQVCKIWFRSRGGACQPEVAVDCACVADVRVVCEVCSLEFM